jgi:hypothetical protein
MYFSRALAISAPMDVNESLSRLFKQSSPSAHEIVLGFRGYLASAHLSAASINRHLATLRSVTKLGRMLGMMSWYLEVPGVKGERRRDVRGPSVDDVSGPKRRWRTSSPARSPRPRRSCPSRPGRRFVAGLVFSTGAVPPTGMLITPPFTDARCTSRKVPSCHLCSAANATLTHRGTKHASEQHVRDRELSMASLRRF